MKRQVKWFCAAVFFSFLAFYSYADNQAQMYADIDVLNGGLEMTVYAYDYVAIRILDGIQYPQMNDTVKLLPSGGQMDVHHSDQRLRLQAGRRLLNCFLKEWPDPLGYSHRYIIC